MKFLNKIFKWLFTIDKDKYMHAVIGALIASLFLSVFCFLPSWINFIISAIMVISSALIKDLIIDVKPDFIDILYTLGGGIIVWLPWIIAFLI